MKDQEALRVPLFRIVNARIRHFEMSLIFCTDEIMNREDNAMRALRDRYA